MDLFQWQWCNATIQIIVPGSPGALGMSLGMICGLNHDRVWAMGALGEHLLISWEPVSSPGGTSLQKDGWLCPQGKLECNWPMISLGRSVLAEGRHKVHSLFRKYGQNTSRVRSAAGSSGRSPRRGGQARPGKCDIHHSYCNLPKMARFPGLLLWNQFLRDLRDSLIFWCWRRH